MRLISGLFAIAVVCHLSPLASAEETPREIIDRAMKARADKIEWLDKQRTRIVTMEGKIYMLDKSEIDSIRQLQIEGASNVFWNTEMATPEGKKRLTMALQGTKGWRQFSGTEAEELSLASIDEFKMEIYGHWLATLTPLKDRAFTLTRLPDAKVGDEPVAVVKAVLRFRPDVQLSFSNKTGQLLKVAYKAREQGVELRKEHIYSDYKTFDGILLPSKQIDTHQLNGQNPMKMAEWNIKEYKFVDKLADDLFNKPEKK